jgi:hypothetical protein
VDGPSSRVIVAQRHRPRRSRSMPKYVIERDVPGAGAMSDDDVRALAARSNEVLDAMAGRAQWVQSYVTDDKLFCVYVADDAAAVHEHAAAGGFPCEAVRAVRRTIDPVTAEA